MKLGKLSIKAYDVSSNATVAQSYIRCDQRKMDEQVSLLLS